MDVDNQTVDNRLIYIDDESGAIEMEEPASLRNIAMAILALLSVCGTIGNALVLYVFSRQKQKLSSTIFILTLAATDFIASLVTMPYTIAVEVLRYKVEYDAACKMYHFLVTTTIPFSAFVMVAIAVDRYLCIVHPFKHYMTIRRAKVIVCLLIVFSATLGVLSCLLYGVYTKPEYFSGLDVHLNSTDGFVNVTKLDGFVNMTKLDTVQFVNFELRNGTYSSALKPQIVHTGKCHKNELIFDAAFFNVYRQIYSSFFGICAVIVIVLYAIIYRSVLTRRRRRLQLTNRCCGFWAQMTTVDQEHEQTEFTVLNNTNKEKGSAINGSENYKDEMCTENSKDKSDDKNGTGGTGGGNADKDALVRPSGVSRAKLEKLRMANIKTALMLSIVACTYIIAFMPAWLMAYQLIPMNVIVFYLYFTYNVANPIIYAFLNQSFRNHLHALFECGNVRN